MQTYQLISEKSLPPRPTRPPAAGIGQPVADVDSRASTRATPAGIVWAATIVGLVLLILMIIFILQNQDPVIIHYLGLVWSLPLGMALFIAAVAGGSLVAAAAALRITQLRTITAKVRRPAKVRPPLFRHGHRAS